MRPANRSAWRVRWFVYATLIGHTSTHLVLQPGLNTFLADIFANLQFIGAWEMWRLWRREW